MNKNLRFFLNKCVSYNKKNICSGLKTTRATILKETSLRGSLQLLTFRKTPTGGHQQSRGLKIIQAGEQTGCVHVIIVLERLIHLDQRNVVVLAGRFVVRMWYEPLEEVTSLIQSSTLTSPTHLQRRFLHVVQIGLNQI